jgi:uncharacterized protein involved in outer membrane biogenesis
MKLRNVLLALVVLVLLGAGGAVYYFYSNLDAIVKQAIEEQGTAALGTDVRVGSVKISPTTGEGTIRGFRVANPSGFPAGDAFTLGEISLAIDLATVTESPVVVKSVTIGAPVVNAVVDEQGRTNLDELRKNAERNAGGGGASEPDTGGGGSGSEVLIRIDRFRFADGKIAADLSALDQGKVDASLPAIELKKVGGQSGSPPAEVGETIAVAFTQAVGTAIARSGAHRLIDEKLGGQEGEAVKSLLDRFMK